MTSTTTRIVQIKRQRYRIEAQMRDDGFSTLYRAVIETGDKRSPREKYVLLREIHAAPNEAAQGWREIDVLASLQVALGNMVLPALPQNEACNLVPAILIHERWANGSGFTVLPVPPGETLADMLKRRHVISELEALSITYQFLAVLCVLHADLKRAMVDFRLDRLYWDVERRSLTIVDWSQVSDVQDDKLSTHLFAQDRREVLFLLYRLLIGTSLPDALPVVMPDMSHGQKLMKSTQLLLSELLVPSTPLLAHGEAMFARIGEEIQRQTSAGDALLLEAAQKLKDTGNSPITSGRRHTSPRLLEEAEALLELAEKRGISERMQVVARYINTDLDEARGRLSHIEDDLAALTIDKALNFLAGRDTKIDRYNPVLHQRVLESVPEWLDGVEQEGYAVDDALRILLQSLSLVAPALQVEVETYRRQLDLLQAANYWVQVPDPSLPLAHIDMENGKETGVNIVQALAALDHALTLLQKIETDVPYARRRRQALVEAFVDSCIQSSYTSALINTWLTDPYPQEFRFLEDGLYYHRLIDQEQSTLDGLQHEIRQAEERLTVLDQEESRQRQRAAQKSDQEREALKQEMVQILSHREYHWVQEIQKQEKHLQSLAQREQALSAKIVDLDTVYGQETKKRLNLLEQKMIQRQRDLAELSERHQRRHNELESAVLNLESNIRQKSREAGELEQIVGVLRAEENKLAQVVAHQHYQEQVLRSEIQEIEAQHERLQKEIDVKRMEAEKYQSLVNQATSIAEFPVRPDSDQIGVLVNSQVITLLALSYDVSPGTNIEERLSLKLRHRAETINTQLARAESYTSAQNQYEEIGHILRLASYLLAATPNRSAITHDLSVIREIYERTRIEFRKRWIKE